MKPNSQWHVLYTFECNPRIKKFKSEVYMRKWIAKFNDTYAFNEEFWIDMVFFGAIAFLDRSVRK